MPLVVLIVISVVGAVELFFQGAENGIIRGVDSVGLRVTWAQLLGFRAAVFEGMLLSNNYPPEHIMRIVTFNFVQRDLLSAIIGLAIFAALGKHVAERFGQMCFLAVFLISPIVGVALYVLLTGSTGLIIGLFPAVFAMIGGYTVSQIETRRELGETILPAFSLIAFFMSIQLIFYFVFGASTEWIAEFFAFVAGFILTYLIGARSQARRKEMLNSLRRR